MSRVKRAALQECLQPLYKAVELYQENASMKNANPCIKIFTIGPLLAVRVSMAFKIWFGLSLLGSPG